MARGLVASLTLVALLTVVTGLVALSGHLSGAGVVLFIAFVLPAIGLADTI